jgi:ADP-ribose pyrophosphatase
VQVEKSVVQTPIEKTLQSEIVFQGKFYAIRRHHVILPDGKKTTREIAEHPGASAGVVFNEKKEVLLVRQYRKAAEAVLVEIPAGKLDPGETPEQCVVREVEEETGVLIEKPQKLSEFFPSPGFTNEKMYIFLARAKSLGSTHQMEDECIWSGFVPFEEALNKIKTGEIQDAKSIIGLLLARDFLQTQGEPWA